MRKDTYVLEINYTGFDPVGTDLANDNGEKNLNLIFETEGAARNLMNKIIETSEAKHNKIADMVIEGRIPVWMAEVCSTRYYMELFHTTAESDEWGFPVTNNKDMRTYEWWRERHTEMIQSHYHTYMEHYPNPRADRVLLRIKAMSGPHIPDTICTSIEVARLMYKVMTDALKKRKITPAIGALMHIDTTEFTYSDIYDDGEELLRSDYVWIGLYDIKENGEKPGNEKLGDIICCDTIDWE